MKEYKARRSACHAPNRDAEDIGRPRAEDKTHHTTRRRHMAVRLLDENPCWLRLFDNRPSCTCPVVEVIPLYWMGGLSRHPISKRKACHSKEMS